MTRELLLIFIGLIALNAVLAYWISTLEAITRQIPRETRLLQSALGVVGFMFILFIGFNSSEINQRNGSLRLATEREVSAARSILNFASGVGPTAEPIRNIILEYLTIVTTTERDWFVAGAKSDAPGEAPVYSLALVTSLFAEQTKGADVIKTFMLARVDELTRARTERITRMQRGAEIVLWIALGVMVGGTQLLAALALSGNRLETGAFFLTYTVVAIVGILYLAWADRLIGPNRIDEQLVPFEALLARAQLPQ